MSTVATSEHPERPQRFKFYASPYAMPKEFESDLDGLSTRSPDAIREAMLRHVERLGLDVADRYVAVGSYGDCVMCHNGVIDQVAESG